MTGVLKNLKERKPSVRGVLADRIGSTMGGGDAGCYALEGIGNIFMPETMDITLIDEAVKVDDDSEFREVKLLAGMEGVLAGSSSGAALAAARTIMERGAKGSIVVILPDRGDRYFSKNLI